MEVCEEQAHTRVFVLMAHLKADFADALADALAHALPDALATQAAAPALGVI